MKDLAVRFDSGKDVLDAYWGYLSDGGLFIPDNQNLLVGDSVDLTVVIVSAEARYSLAGRVVRRDSNRGRCVIAFEPGQPHDMLLTQALADADNVPARRSRRFSVNIDAKVHQEGDVDHAAQLVDVSDHGCCLRISEADDDDDFFAIGTSVEISVEPHKVRGKVVWQRKTDRGVAFMSPGQGNDATARDIIEPCGGESVELFVRNVRR